MAKRKLTVEESDEKKNRKIIKLCETIVEMNDITAIASGDDERKLNFKLTDKKAKSNLLKGASRVHLEIEAKQKSKNLRFSTGAFLYVAKQLICLTLRSMLPLNQIPSQEYLFQQVQIRPMYL